MKWKAAKTSLALCVLFVVVYGACNRITAMRDDVGAFYFAWERYIPFVPLMIVPYMSIDLFFVAAPFLCRDDRERYILAHRITAAILIAGACFLLFPMRFAFDRPQAGGLLGTIFDHFREMDLPYNQFPSLHIALRTILAIHYVRHSSGILRLANRIWFSLIGFSTILTYQHHLIDIVGGFALGAACIQTFNGEPANEGVLVNRRVGAYYALGCIGMTGLAKLTAPLGLLLLWPAMSLGIVAAGYVGLGPSVYRKADGELPLMTRLLLWPVLLGQRLSLVYYARQSRPWDQLTANVWIGRMLCDWEARDAIDKGATAVLDLTGEFTESRAFRSIVYCNVAILDLTAPTADQINRAVAFIRAQADGGVVYVHCKAGYSRTAAIAGAYLLASGQADSVDRAIAMLRAARRRIVIRPEVFACLNDYADRITATKAQVAISSCPDAASNRA